MTINFSGTVFFYIPTDCLKTKLPIEIGYVHQLVCLAEVLKALGIEFYANGNYWRISADSEEYLFRYNPEVQANDCSIVVVTDLSPDGIDLFHPRRKYTTVAFDDADGVKTFSLRPEYRQVDFIFKTHLNSRLKFPDNCHPWAFGLSERICQELETLPDFQKRDKIILCNYRNFIYHTVRMVAQKDFLPEINKVLPIDDTIDQFITPPSDPQDYLQWHQSGRRHFPNYYKRLKKSAACACFGGFFVPPIPKDPTSTLSLLLKNCLSKFNLKSNTILQWDSWRLWESLAAGCAIFHLDFDKYACQLPVMPENWRHYIGIDLDNIPETINRIQSEPEILEKVSIAGRHWALENYNPVATTLRFLGKLGY
jgi:hypothetical protein